MALPDDLPLPEEIIATHDIVEETWDLKFRGARVAAPRLKLERLLEDVGESDPVYPRAAHLLRSLITAHYFEDGNKRTAWLTTRNYLQHYDRDPATTDREDVVPVLKRVRAFDADELSVWLEIGDIDEERLGP